jgi:hypothetical protein
MKATEIENRVLWAIHRDARREAQRQGADPRCAEQIAFRATDIAEGKPPRVVTLCQKCIARGVDAGKAAA